MTYKKIIINDLSITYIIIKPRKRFFYMSYKKIPMYGLSPNKDCPI